jgi:two-component system response regulator YesN
MIKLLIVDDEPYTVDGLYEMLTDVPGLDLELYRAYSAEEAIQRLTRTKMDIVLSDMRMPGMNGLELQQWIRNRWPRCKVIFLTGISDIEYAQQAIRGGGVDYILKTEGDEALVRSIRKVIVSLNEDAHHEQFLRKAKDQLSQTLPILRKEWFMNVVDQAIRPSHLLETRFKELGINLSLNEKVLLISGKVDRWKDGYGSTDQALLLYAIQNIAEEYVTRAAFLPILLEGSEFVWLLQPKCETQDPVESDETWSDFVAYVLGTLESIQTTCRELLHAPISMVCTGIPVTWEVLSETYRQLKHTMLLGLGNGEEMLITDCRDEQHAAHPELSQRVVSDLERALESGLQEEFEQRLADMFQKVPNWFGEYVHLYYSVALLLLEHIHRMEFTRESISSSVIEKLMNLAHHESKTQAFNMLRETARDLFVKRKQTMDDRTHRIIHKLNEHIRINLAADLSLDTLADVVYLNSSYLSSLYKQCTGMNISDYIANLRIVQARELLQQPQLKIHEIAESCGFGTAGYFTRFFKKHVGVTPQEYRASNEAK